MPARKRRTNKRTYQANCQKMAFWRRVRCALQRSYKLTFICIVFLISLTSYWVYRDNSSEGLLDLVSNEFYETTAEAGLKLELVTFEGEKYIGQAQLVEELMLLDGTPILSLDLTDLREEIKQRNWVKDAKLKRILPSKLQITIVEREPVAVWQFQHQLHLIDEDGIVLTNLDSADGLPFPLLVGEGANDEASRIFELLRKEKVLYDRMEAAIRLNDRRWNIIFMNGIEVMLPEKDFDEAWKKLSRLHIEKQVLDRNVTTIDLRMPDRVYIKTPGGNENLNLAGSHSA